MRLEPPSWWYGSGGADRLKASLLSPLSLLYGSGVRARFALAKPYRSKLPVICIGNFTLGGAGKTPLALAVAEILRELGHRPAFLTRGYGGKLQGPHLVDSVTDRAGDVGDEALLLARQAPTMLARIRPDGARAIEELGVSIIVMDDGFQNPSLAKDLSIIAVDGVAGIGNGQVFPSGPLRAQIGFQLKRADAVVMIGDDSGPSGAFLGGAVPVMKASLAPSCDLDWLRTQPVFAFSGIGRPAKFFDMLRGLGADLAGAEAFPDHHMYDDSDAKMLMMNAAKSGAVLVTTEKDQVRLAADAGLLMELKSSARAIPVKLIFPEPSRRQLLNLLQGLPPQ
jgi:tetraacyldisaccharide 4'-kinase